MLMIFERDWQYCSIMANETRELGRSSKELRF
jgi:hypothetical protein